MQPQVLLIIQLILRISGVLICSSKAKDLNRSAISWGMFGFLMPIIAMIWIHCLKPQTSWHNMDENKN